MSKFFNKSLSGLNAYVPGEQLKGKFIKLNTNENPYSPSRFCAERIGADKINDLRLYSDPECFELRSLIAAYYGVYAENVTVTNGSDDALSFCFSAFCEEEATFADITYGFYEVLCGLNKLRANIVPLKEDFTVDFDKLKASKSTVFLPNPNAQTGIYAPISEIEELLKSKKNEIVVIDEAYIDFGGESCVKLIDKYENLVVVQTFSKSRSLAGARVGFVIANRELIADLNRIRYSFNPYSVNSLSLLIAAEAVKDRTYFDECREKIQKSRARLTAELEKIGFYVLPSLANFVLAKSRKVGGDKLYLELKKRGILVRYFAQARISGFVRITIGTDSQMEKLIEQIKEVENEIC